MKKLTFLLLITLFTFSCGEKEDVKPVSKSALLHIEYRATDKTATESYQSRVQLVINGIDCDKFSAFNIDNIITYDTLVQGGQEFIFSAYPAYPYYLKCGDGSFIPVSCMVTFNGKTIYQKSYSETCSNSLAMTGSLEFIN